MAHTSTSPAAAPRLPNRSSSWCSALKPARAHRPGRDPAAEPLPGGTPRGTFVGEVATGRATGAPVFTLSRPRSGPDGRPDGGVLGAAFRPAEFAAFYATIAEHPGDVAALARAEDGAVLAMHPPPGRPVGFRLPDPGGAAAAFRAAGERPALLRLGGLAPDGTARLVALRRLADDYPVVIAYGLHPEVPWRDWLTRLLAPGLGAATAAALLLWLTARAQQWAHRGREEAERRAELEARLRRSEAVAALGQLAAGVAHDFGNAVQSVASGARLLERDAADPEKVRRLAALIAGAAERGAALARRMLDFARRGAAGQAEAGAPPPSPLDPAAALEEMAELLAYTFGPRFRVRCCRVVGAPDPPPVRVDRAELEAVVVNLAVNARDAMPGGGEIAIEVAGETPPPPPHGGPPVPGLEPGAAYARIVVRDTGEGMDPATLARAGEAFFTTKPLGRGTGLGLSMARGFAGRAGGTLRIESARGRGTAVTLWLRAAEGEDATTGGAAAAAA